MTYSDNLIAVSELKEHLRDADLRVVDCRFELSEPDKGWSDYLAGHIPGAVYAHLDRDLAGPVRSGSGRHPLPEPAVFADTLGRWGISRRTQVVVYDGAGGAIAARLWWMLRWLGHESARLLDGGFSAWQRAGLPQSTELPQVEPTRYDGEPDDNLIVTTREVHQALLSGAPLTLVDARDPERFAGNAEPIDPVAGHIPGARNFPFIDSLNSDGSWRSATELRECWRNALGDGPGGAAAGDHPAGTAWAAMCGSGVTACHLAVSAQLAGIPQPRLYVGSWSEWIRDRRRPVATGPGEGPGQPDAGAQ